MDFAFDIKGIFGGPFCTMNLNMPPKSTDDYNHFKPET